MDERLRYLVNLFIAEPSEETAMQLARLVASSSEVTRPEWTIVSDNLIRHFWQCENCNRTIWVEPDFYSVNGIPMCGDCDDGQDMVYVNTNILL